MSGLSLQVHIERLTAPDKLKCGDHAGHIVTSPGHTHLLAVADGVGSHSCDWVASETACRSAIGTFRATDGSMSDRLLAAVHRAHQDVQDLDGAAEGATSTLVLAAWTEGEEFCRHVSVGDSRLYRIDTAGVSLLTADDSVRVPVKIGGEFVVSAGAICFASPITRAIGYGYLGDTVVEESPLHNGDMIAAVTDGFHELNGFEGRLAAVFAAVDPVKTVKAELVAAHEREGRDDATVAVLRRQEVDRHVLDACRKMVQGGSIVDGADLPRHLLTRGLVALMSRLAAETNYEDLIAGVSFVRAEGLRLSREDAASVLDALMDDGSELAKRSYRELSRVSNSSY